MSYSERQSSKRSFDNVDSELRILTNSIHKIRDYVVKNQLENNLMVATLKREKLHVIEAVAKFEKKVAEMNVTLAEKELRHEMDQINEKLRATRDGNKENCIDNTRKRPSSVQSSISTKVSPPTSPNQSSQRSTTINVEKPKDTNNNKRKATDQNNDRPKKSKPKSQTEKRTLEPKAQSSSVDKSPVVSPSASRSLVVSQTCTQELNLMHLKAEPSASKTNGAFNKPRAPQNPEFGKSQFVNLPGPSGLQKSLNGSKEPFSLPTSSGNLFADAILEYTKSQNAENKNLRDVTNNLYKEIMLRKSTNSRYSKESEPTLHLSIDPEDLRELLEKY